MNVFVLDHGYVLRTVLEHAVAPFLDPSIPTDLGSPDRIVLAGPIPSNSIGNLGFGLAELLERFPNVPTLVFAAAAPAVLKTFGGDARLHPTRPGLERRLCHAQQGLFAGLPSPLTVAQYGSLELGVLPSDFEVLAFDDANHCLAFRHRCRPITFVGFDPLSIGSDVHPALIQTFFKGNPS
jgi:anthranilate/para-aminobenzoate synthase component II